MHFYYLVYQHEYSAWHLQAIFGSSPWQTGLEIENLKENSICKRLDLVFRVLRILITSALFWSIVTHLKVKCSPPNIPNTGHQRPLLPAHLSHGVSTLNVCLWFSPTMAALANAGLRIITKITKYPPLVVFALLSWLGNRARTICMSVSVESRWLHHLTNTASL